MRITDAKVIVCSPGRNFVTLKLVTEDGIYGLGDATLNGRELAVASYLRDHVVPLLIGRDARRIEDYVAVPLQRRVLAARAGDDGRDCGRRYGAVGHPGQGAGRAGVSAARRSVARRGAGLRPRERRDHRRHGRGSRAIRSARLSGGAGAMRRAWHARCLRRRPRRARSTSRRRKRGRSRPPGAPRTTCTSCPSSSRGCGDEFGPDLHLLHDAHHRLTPIEAARLGKSLEPYHLFWLEDPVPAELQESFRLIRQHTTTPLAVGEVFNVIHDCHQLIQEQLIDYIRTTVVHAGGISHLRKIASLAELHHVRTGSHGATDLSPVCMAGALHFDLSVHNFGIQEYMRHTRRDRPRVSASLHARRRPHASGRRARPRRGHRRNVSRRSILTSRRIFQ